MNPYPNILNHFFTQHLPIISLFDSSILMPSQYNIQTMYICSLFFRWLCLDTKAIFFSMSDIFPDGHCYTLGFIKWLLFVIQAPFGPKVSGPRPLKMPPASLGHGQAGAPRTSMNSPCGPRRDPAEGFFYGQMIFCLIGLNP